MESQTAWRRYWSRTARPRAPLLGRGCCWELENQVAAYMYNVNVRYASRYEGNKKKEETMETTEFEPRKISCHLITPAGNAR